MNISFVTMAFSVFLLLTSICLKLTILIPLYFKYARVQNGLARMRKLFLVKGLIQLFVDVLVTIEAVWVVLHFSNIHYQTASATYFLTFAFGFIVLTYVDWLFFHQQYTPENIRLHEKIAHEENKIKVIKSKRKGR